MPEDKNPKAAQAAADGKLPLHLIDTALTHPTSRVLAGGAKNYGKRNWRKVPINASTYVGALRRHTDEWADGADTDKDSGEHPLAHIAATCNVVLDAIKHGTLVDDRHDADAIERPAPAEHTDDFYATDSGMGYAPITDLPTLDTSQLLPASPDWGVYQQPPGYRKPLHPCTKYPLVQCSCPPNFCC